MDGPRKLHSFEELARLVPGASPPETQRETPRKDAVRSFVTLRVGFEKSGRRGKGVTVVTGFHHTRDDLENLARRLKNACGAGGTVREDALEIQGDQREKVAELLRAEGFTVKVRG